MQITRATDYAIRCVYCLARHPGELWMIDDIAREMEIPNSFLAKILQKLARAQIVESQRGVRGGFRLARAPEEISLHDVVVATEGPVAMNVCTLEGERCDRVEKCRVHPVWVTIRQEVEEALQKRKFADFL
ncbi:RrF2 family transcriptional regulator [Desulfurivibrio alkaliphilus]|uniref:Transcriptional regulator, BadM/Rrf2 family n=1 Tax=Desulfurivibrio alkaliphilus (strain DSM 19089 / UNIQEM U267 / AHT2) TaxID=589865 RepID=D6Z603_DESAT|nr:Rrf2 family transcriptional regulator [Desulfurivibrio alkaliphilus]ADH84885.1 transcriptional regulator, BadM/Rrf2 family [Desulfurivibrio alkaliphilus AHT 2]